MPETRLNIVIANATRGWGGVNTWAVDAALRLQQSGHHINILAREGRFARRAVETGLPVTITEYGMDFHPFRVREFQRLFKRWGTRILIANIAKELRTAGVAARLSGIPVVLRLGLPGDLADRPKVRLVHRLLRPKLLAPCEFVKQGLLRELPFLRPEEIKVILTGKEPAAAPPAPPAETRPPRLIVTSQLNPDKGHEDLLQALAELRDRGHAFELRVLGTGRIEFELKRLCASLDLDERVSWLGYRADVLDQLRQCDIFVLPSLSEGLPNSLLEAMSQGLAPVSRRVGGVEEVWPASLAGQLFNDRAGLVRALGELLTRTPAQLLEARRQAWRQCVEVFAIRDKVAELEAWLAGVAE